MRRQAPPLEAIEAFIVATRSGSFRAAADEMALSPSAFSRRIQSLEAFLGAPLFDRSQNSLRLTTVGERYRSEVEPAMDIIRGATSALSTRGAGDPLTLVTPQSFAMAWLVPRLSGVMRDVQVSIRIGHGLKDLRNGDADLAIVTGPRDTHGLPYEPLVMLDAVPVAAPQLIDGRTPPRAISELADYPRLAVYKPERLWETWAENVGVVEETLKPPTRYESMFVMYEAAAAGLGVALGVRLLIERFLKDGRLQPCGAERQAPIGVQYWLVYANPAVRRWRQSRVFSAWLHEEIARSRTDLLAA
jgi:LysR family glycine cleavage system transcriptional activator